jgi:5,10-methenyltetrahydrofolate synthetase
MSAGLMREADQGDERRARRDALRRAAIDRRLALSGENCAALAQEICAQLAQNFAQLAKMRVAFYWPIQNEPDLRHLLARWHAAADPGFAALLPVVVKRGSPLVFRRWQPGGKLVRDACGILAPGEGEYEIPQALLIPVNAFDEELYRLGYGGGYYDRTLAALADLAAPPLTIGVGFELARVDTIEPQAHDIRLDAVVTETGTCRRG